MTFTSQQVAAATGLSHTNVSHRLARLFDMPALGSGNGPYQFTLGQLVAARVLRGLRGQDPYHRENKTLRDAIAADVPALIDSPTPPRYVVFAGVSMLMSTNSVELVAEVTRHCDGVAHVIDVDATLAELGHHDMNRG